MQHFQRVLLFVLALAVCGGLAFGAADDISRLHTFVSGQPIVAADHNAEHDLFVNTLNGKGGRGVANTWTAANTYSDASGITTDDITERTAGNGVDIDDVVLKDGGATFTAAVTLPAAAPTDDNHATRKLYVDNLLSTPTGTVSMYISETAPSGWVLLDGDTIGETGSSATERANDDTSALYTLIYDNCADAQCPVSGGRSGTASTDFAAGKTLTLPDMRGRMAIGLDDMGGSSANVVTHANADVMAGTEGSETHTLDVTEIPAHTHTYGNSADNIGAGGGTSVKDAENSNDYTTGSTGGGAAHENMSPYLALVFMIKL